MEFFQELRVSSNFYKMLMDALCDGVYCTDMERRIIYWNPSAERLTGFSSAEVVGSRCSDNLLQHVSGEGECLCNGMCPLAATVADGIIREAQVFLHHKQGHRLPVFVRTSRLINEDNQTIGGVEIFTEASTYLKQQEEIEFLQRQSLLDALTELPNRRYYQQAIEITFDEYRRYGAPFGLLMFDVDDFKRVNDQYGHDQGDLVLQMVAKSLQRCSRSSDFVFRWGGEEFVMIIKNINQEKLHELAERQRLLVKLSYLRMGHERLSVTVSGGATMVRSNDSPESIFHRADKYLCQGKSREKNCVIDDVSSLV